MVKYYLSHQGQQVGPWSYQEIVSQLEAKKADWTDYIYDEKSSGWVLLAEHDLMKAYFNKKEKPESHVLHPGNDKKWFILKSENKYGPFSYFELVKMLQEKSLSDSDYIWTAAMASWKRFPDCDEFKAEKIRELKNSNLPEVEKIFLQRRFARAKFGAAVLVHNSKTVWKGKSLELSSGGAGLIIENQSFEPGQTLFLHFKVGDKVPPFNAICSVVSKQYVSSNAKEVKYGVKFTNISRDVRHAIKAFTDHEA